MRPRATLIEQTFGQEVVGVTAVPAPQPVKILPDGTGLLHRLRILPDGTREAYVSWVGITTGFKGGLVDHDPEWIPEVRIRRMSGTDYSAIDAAIEDVGTTPGSTGGTAPATGLARCAPPGWPPQVLPPDDPEWVRSATSWLLDILPPDYRTHAAIVAMPRVLAWMAATHVDRYQAATQQGYRTAAVDLRAFDSPEVIEQVLDVYRAEKDRLATVREGIRAVRRSLATQAR
ncbi:hypothetical protein FE391_45860 [Nonomuraea sp. KC401]|uniref:hypothetical protein n=1 Tax=unclassified Nonomuraea TaxID=2593643 RepID=UPI0010FF0CD7|nr:MULTISPECIES: hypothetical protein [unclassified Nonomuraea]NBF00505.1 hypothetical protein [Nonomuraea sp. K271]TLF47837.1 hypothetical protein FE391_45860 [Nonomuraea sp. KC401]